MTKLSPRHDPNGEYVSFTDTPWGGSVRLSDTELVLRDALQRNPSLSMTEARSLVGMTQPQLNRALDRLAQDIAPYKESEATVEPTECVELRFDVPFDGDEAGLDEPDEAA